MLPTEDNVGKLSPHYVFADPSSPHRKLTVEMTTGHSLHTQRLTAAGNMYEKMGVGVFQSSIDHQADVNRAAYALFRHGTAMPTLAEHLQKVNPELYQERLVSSSAGASSSTGTVPVAGSTSMVSGGLPPSGSFFVQAAAPMSRLSQTFEPVAAPSPQPKLAKQGAGETDAMATASPPHSGKDADRGLDIEADDSVSQIGVSEDGENEDCTANFRKLSSKEKLKVIKGRINLQMLLQGKALGRQERNAKKYLTNGVLEKNDIGLLRNFMKQVWHGPF
jgi:hypothetical protein